jgi:hypothetical protein
MSLEFEIELQRLKVMQEKRNIKQRILMKKQLNIYQKELNKLSYKYFEDPEMYSKIKIINQNFNTIRKALKDFENQNN